MVGTSLSIGLNWVLLPTSSRSDIELKCKIIWKLSRSQERIIFFSAENVLENSLSSLSRFVFLHDRKSCKHVFKDSLSISQKLSQKQNVRNFIATHEARIFNEIFINRLNEQTLDNLKRTEKIVAHKTLLLIFHNVFVDVLVLCKQLFLMFTLKKYF